MEFTHCLFWGLGIRGLGLKQLDKIIIETFSFCFPSKPRKVLFLNDDLHTFLWHCLVCGDRFSCFWVEMLWRKLLTMQSCIGYKFQSKQCNAHKARMKHIQRTTGFIFFHFFSFKRCLYSKNGQVDLQGLTMKTKMIIGITCLWTSLESTEVYC